jgi:predicted class III extradiol MEMO1 family dioxygenase
LKETGKFDKLSVDADEDEHSIEMQLPYVYKVFESKYISVNFILIVTNIFE